MWEVLLGPILLIATGTPPPALPPSAGDVSVMAAPFLAVWGPQVEQGPAVLPEGPKHDDWFVIADPFQVFWGPLGSRNPDDHPGPDITTNPADWFVVHDPFLNVITYQERQGNAPTATSLLAQGATLTDGTVVFVTSPVPPGSFTFRGDTITDGRVVFTTSGGGTLPTLLRVSGDTVTNGFMYGGSGGGAGALFRGDSATDGQVSFTQVLTEVTGLFRGDTMTDGLMSYDFGSSESCMGGGTKPAVGPYLKITLCDLRHMGAPFGVDPPSDTTADPPLFTVGDYITTGPVKSVFDPNPQCTAHVTGVKTLVITDGVTDSGVTLPDDYLTYCSDHGITPAAVELTAIDLETCHFPLTTPTTTWGTGATWIFDSLGMKYGRIAQVTYQQNAGRRLMLLISAYCAGANSPACFLQLLAEPYTGVQLWPYDCTQYSLLGYCPPSDKAELPLFAVGDILTARAYNNLPLIPACSARVLDAMVMPDSYDPGIWTFVDPSIRPQGPWVILICQDLQTCPASMTDGQWGSTLLFDQTGTKMATLAHVWYVDQNIVAEMGSSSNCTG